jgi:hypothetical protein
MVGVQQDALVLRECVEGQRWNANLWCRRYAVLRGFWNEKSVCTQHACFGLQSIIIQRILFFSSFFVRFHFSLSFSHLAYHL